MKIEFITKNCNANDKLKGIIEDKVAKLDKYFEEDTKCKVYLKKEGKSSKLEISLEYKGNFVRAQSYGDNFYNAIDEVLPKIEGQVRKHRTKLEKKLKQGAFTSAPVFADNEPEEIKLARVKHFDLVPMSIEEAIAEFELMGHNFFVFLEAESKKIKVLYLRDDGDLGLLDLNY